VRVLLTGAGGFVGPHVTRALEAAGHAVVRLVGPKASAQEATPVDLTDARATLEAVRTIRPEAVVHLAARARPGGAEHLQTLLDNNARCAGNVLAACHSAMPRARIVLVSSSAVYGQVPKERNPIGELEALQPVLPYGVSKVAVEAIGSTYRALGLDIVTVRPFNLAGPGQAPGFIPASFARQIVALESGPAGRVVEAGSLEAVRDLTDVRDAARAFALLLEGRPGPGPYNVCSGTPRRVGDVLMALLTLAGLDVEVRTGVDAMLEPSLDIPYQCGDARAVAAAVGWRPEIPWEQTLRDTLWDWRLRLARGAKV